MPNIERLPWFANHNNLLTLANWLHHEHGDLQTATQVLYFFEKPWKWETEWGEFQAWRQQQ